MMKIAIQSRYMAFVVLLLGFQGISYAKISNYSLGGLIETALNYHPSIKASVHLQSAFEQGVDAAQWQYFPTPSLSVSQVDASKTDTNYNGDSRVVTLGLTQPLWSGGALDANLEKAQAQLAIKKSKSLIAKRDLALRLIKSYSVWLGSYLKFNVYLASQKEHQLLQKRIKRRIEQGLSSNSDLDLVNSRLLQVKASLNMAEIRHENALLQLQEAVGEPLDLKALKVNISPDYPVQGELPTLLAGAIL